MDLLGTRQKSNNNDLLEKRFIGLILKEESQELNQAQTKLMNSRNFSNPKFFNNRGFQVLEDHKLQYTHPTVLRFIDMKQRNGKKKISHSVHNKPLYAMMNNILRRLQFEFTDKLKKTLMQQNDVKI